MMNDPLKRKMFRQVGMSKQPMGILASSPELMNTVKGYANGGVEGRRAQRQNNPTGFSLSDFFINPAGAASPSGQNKRFTVPTDDNNQQIFDMSQENAIIPTNPAFINEANKKIIEGVQFPEGSNLGAKVDKDDKSFETEKKEPTKSDISADTLYGGVSEKITEEATKISDAYDKLTTNTADLKDMEFLGTTFNKEAAKQMELLKSKDKEFTIAEAQEVYKKMGGKTDEELDEQYGEDREASFWLNMMKAGAAMAAGGSSNTLTNFAKGFTVGLEGYGKDIGQLRKELREDKKESSKTIYKLLQDGKSERLAKKALDIQKSAAITNLLKTEVGDEQARLIREVENEVANRKLTISVYKSFADMNFETKKFNVGRDDFNKSITMAYAKMMPEDLKILQAAGQIKIIDPTKPLTPDNITATPEGVKNIENLLTKNLSGKITDTQVAISTAGGLGKTDSGIVFDKEQEGYNKKEIGTAIKEYNKRRTETIKSLGQETNIVANQDIQFAKVYGGKIDLSKQTERMKQIFTAPGKDGTRSLLEKNIELFTNIN
jgi:hypothetical protein